MAANTTATASAKQEGYVELYVPRGYSSDDPNLIIGINGKLYVLPKGETSMVPKEVKEEFDRSQRAQNAFDKKSAELIKKANKPINQT